LNQQNLGSDVLPRTTSHSPYTGVLSGHMSGVLSIYFEVGWSLDFEVLQHEPHSFVVAVNG